MKGGLDNFCDTFVVNVSDVLYVLEAFANHEMLKLKLLNGFIPLNRIS